MCNISYRLNCERSVIHIQYIHICIWQYWNRIKSIKTTINSSNNCSCHAISLLTSNSSKVVNKRSPQIASLHRWIVSADNGKWLVRLQQRCGDMSNMCANTNIPMSATASRQLEVLLNTAAHISLDIYWHLKLFTSTVLCGSFNVSRNLTFRQKHVKAVFFFYLNYFFLCSWVHWLLVSS